MLPTTRLAEERRFSKGPPSDEDPGATYWPRRGSRKRSLGCGLTPADSLKPKRALSVRELLAQVQGSSTPRPGLLGK